MLHPAAHVRGNWNFELAGEAMVFCSRQHTLRGRRWRSCYFVPGTSCAEGAEVVRLRLLTTFLCCHEAVSCFILEDAVVFAGVAAVGPRGDATEFGSGLH